MEAQMFWRESGKTRMTPRQLAIFRISYPRMEIVWHCLVGCTVYSGPHREQRIAVFNPTDIRTVVAWCDAHSVRFFDNNE
jgi:hypothetical protein